MPNRSLSSGGDRPPPAAQPVPSTHHAQSTTEEEPPIVSPMIRPLSALEASTTSGGGGPPLPHSRRPITSLAIDSTHGMSRKSSGEAIDGWSVGEHSGVTRKLNLERDHSGGGGGALPPLPPSSPEQQQQQPPSVLAALLERSASSNSHHHDLPPLSRKASFDHHLSAKEDLTPLARKLSIERGMTDHESRLGSHHTTPDPSLHRQNSLLQIMTDEFTPVTRPNALHNNNNNSQDDFRILTRQSSQQLADGLHLPAHLVRSLSVDRDLVESSQNESHITRRASADRFVATATATAHAREEENFSRRNSDLYRVTHEEEYRHNSDRGSLSPQLGGGGGMRKPTPDHHYHLPPLPHRSSQERLSLDQVHAEDAFDVRPESSSSRHHHHHHHVTPTPLPQPPLRHDSHERVSMDFGNDFGEVTNANPTTTTTTTTTTNAFHHHHPPPANIAIHRNPSHDRLSLDSGMSPQITMTSNVETSSPESKMHSTYWSPSMDRVVPQSSDQDTSSTPSHTPASISLDYRHHHHHHHQGGMSKLTLEGDSTPVIGMSPRDVTEDYDGEPDTPTSSSRFDEEAAALADNPRLRDAYAAFSMSSDGMMTPSLGAMNRKDDDDVPVAPQLLGSSFLNSSESLPVRGGHKQRHFSESRAQRTTNMTKGYRDDSSPPDSPQHHILNEFGDGDDDTSHLRGLGSPDRTSNLDDSRDTVAMAVYPSTPTDRGFSFQERAISPSTVPSIGGEESSSTPSYSRSRGTSPRNGEDDTSPSASRRLDDSSSQNDMLSPRFVSSMVDMDEIALPPRSYQSPTGDLAGKEEHSMRRVDSQSEMEDSPHAQLMRVYAAEADDDTSQPVRMHGNSEVGDGGMYVSDDGQGSKASESAALGEDSNGQSPAAAMVVVMSFQDSSSSHPRNNTRGGGGVGGGLVAMPQLARPPSRGMSPHGGPPHGLERSFSSGARRVRFNPEVVVHHLPSELREDSRKARIGKHLEAPWDDELWDGDLSTFRARELTPEELRTLKMQRRLSSAINSIAPSNSFLGRALTQPLGRIFGGVDTVGAHAKHMPQADAGDSSSTTTPHVSLFSLSGNNRSGSVVPPATPLHLPMKRGSLMAMSSSDNSSSGGPTPSSSMGRRDGGGGDDKDSFSNLESSGGGATAKHVVKNPELVSLSHEQLFLRYSELHRNTLSLAKKRHQHRMVDVALSTSRRELVEVKARLTEIRRDLPLLESRIERNANPRLLHYLQFDRADKVRRLKRERMELLEEKKRNELRVEQLAKVIYENANLGETLRVEIEHLVLEEEECSEIIDCYVNAIRPFPPALIKFKEKQDDYNEQIIEADVYLNVLQGAARTAGEATDALGQILRELGNIQSSSSPAMDSSGSVGKMKASLFDSPKKAPVRKSSSIMSKQRELEKCKSDALAAIDLLQTAFVDRIHHGSLPQTAALISSRNVKDVIGVVSQAQTVAIDYFDTLTKAENLTSERAKLLVTTLEAVQAEETKERKSMFLKAMGDRRMNE